MLKPQISSQFPKLEEKPTKSWWNIPSLSPFPISILIYDQHLWHSTDSLLQHLQPKRRNLICSFIKKIKAAVSHWGAAFPSWHPPLARRGAVCTHSSDYSCPHNILTQMQIITGSILVSYRTSRICWYPILVLLFKYCKCRMLWSWKTTAKIQRIWGKPVK